MEILGRSVERPFRGCGGCPARKICPQSLQDIEVTATHTGREMWEDPGHGRAVAVFGPQDEVKITLRTDAGKVYCGHAESTRFRGVTDFVNLRNFSNFKE